MKKDKIHMKTFTLVRGKNKACNIKLRVREWRANEGNEPLVNRSLTLAPN